MNIDAHLQKFRQFDGARQRLDPFEDFDLWYWAVSSAATAVLNAALHRLGVTRENRYFATQVPDVYGVADSGQTWHYEIASDCDLIHAGIPALPSIPAALEAAFEAMHEIERYRNPCIRGEHPVTEELVEGFDHAYVAVLKVTTAILEGKGA